MSPEELKKWQDYQNEVNLAVQSMSAAQLDEFINSLESTIFEAKAKYQRAYAEKNTRQVEARKKSREELINDPRYSAPDGPGKPNKPFPKPAEPRKSKSERLGDMLSMFGIGAGDLMKDAQKLKDDKRKAEDVKKAEAKVEEKKAKFEAIPVAQSEDCLFSPTGKHELKDGICKWCNERK